MAQSIIDGDIEGIDPRNQYENHKSVTDILERFAKVVYPKVPLKELTSDEKGLCVKLIKQVKEDLDYKGK